MPKAADLWKQFQNQSGAKPRILRKFTGRHVFLRDHYKLISRAIEEEFGKYYIRNYHGIGGAGKSTLLRRLEAELLGEETLLKEKLPEEEFPEELSEDEAIAFREARACCESARASVRDWCRKMGRGKKPVVLRADFDDAALRSSGDVLLRFRSQLMQQYDKAMFPLFDIAMLRLAQKYGRRLPPDEQKEMLIDNPVISFALDTVGDLTGVGLLIGAAQTAAKVGKSVAQTLAGQKNAIRRVNEEASRMDAPDLERRLPWYFAMDVNAMNLPLICVYLDTYEKMTAQAEGAGWSVGFDEEWLKGDFGLVRNLGNAVFAIAGQKKLEWGDLPVEECQVDAQPVAAQSVEALSEAESLIFLASCGIQDEQLRSQLHSLTGGEPIYLDLCVDEYERMTVSGKEQISIEDFGGSRERLVERHTRYIPPNLRDALSLLAAMGRWTDIICEELTQTLPIPSPAGTEYYQLTHLSYVRMEGDDSWTMHRPVAEVLAKNLTPALRERLISALLDRALRDLFALDILAGMAKDVPNCRIAEAMERQALSDREAGRYREAREWQEKAIALWEALSSKYPAQHGASLAALADIQWAQLNDRPTLSKEDEENTSETEEALRERHGWQALRDFCRGAIETCEGLGDGLEEALVRLWERRANAEDKLRAWDTAITSWGQVLELYIRLDRPAAEQLNARLQIGWDHKLAKHREKACTVLEAALQGLSSLDRDAGRAYTPKTLLAAELLCQCCDDPELDAETRGLWSERLKEVQEWLRSLDYTLTGKESLEELLDWQSWINVGRSGELWFHSGVGKAGADVSERLQRAFDLDDRIIPVLADRLGELHPAVLDANMTLVNIYLNHESTKGAAKMLDPDYAVRLVKNSWAPLGSVPEKVICLFPDPEAVLSACRRTVDAYKAAMGREYPDTYAARNLLAHAYEMAGRPADAIAQRQELWAAYSRLDDQASRGEALRQNSLLIRDNRLAGQWEKAIALQTRRLERARTDKLPELSPAQERDSLCTLYLSRLWQDEELSRDQAQELLTGLLASVEEFRPDDRKRYLDSAWQWCRDYAGEELEDAAADVSLALADTLSFGDEVIDLLEPYAEERTLSVPRRCAILLRLSRAYRSTRSGQGRSVDLLEELTELLDAHPEMETPDMGTALLELGISRRKLAQSLVGDDFRRTAKEMLEALRGALAWRETHLSPEDLATDAARFGLADALIWVGKRQEAIPLLEAALSFRRTALGETAKETVEAELGLVAALARTEGRYEEARALFQAAQRHMEGLRFPLSTHMARYALYRGAGGALSLTEWKDAGEPEHD